MPRGFEFMRARHRRVGAAAVRSVVATESAPVLARLRTLDAERDGRQANGELAHVTPAMRSALKKTNEWGRDGRVVSLQEAVVGDVRSTLLILLAAVGLILLLAAVNLGTLVLGRSIERAREMAVRTALGASRSRLIRQLIAEQAVLAVGRRACGSVDRTRIACPC